MSQTASAAASDLSVVANNLEIPRKDRRMSDAEMARIVRKSRLTLMGAVSDAGDDAEAEREARFWAERAASPMWNYVPPAGGR